MTTLLVTVFVASLVGSLHCAGMCGGFVAFYAGSMPPGRGRRWLCHLGYNCARLVVYSGLGLTAGLLGAQINIAGSTASLQRLAAVMAGVVMLLWGGALLASVLGLRLPKPKGDGPVARFLARQVDGLAERPPIVRATLLGALTVLLPCGWLYAFVVAAAGTGSVAGGVAVMVAFWVGTVPVMLGLGLGVQQLSRWLGRALPALTAVALIGIGVASLIGRVDLKLPKQGRTPTSVQESTKSVEALGSGKKKPCCGHGKGKKH